MHTFDWLSFLGYVPYMELRRCINSLLCSAFAALSVRFIAWPHWWVWIIKTGANFQPTLANGAFLSFLSRCWWLHWSKPITTLGLGTEHNVACDCPQGMLPDSCPQGILLLSGLLDPARFFFADFSSGLKCFERFSAQLCQHVLVSKFDDQTLCWKQGRFRKHIKCFGQIYASDCGNVQENTETELCGQLLTFQLKFCLASVARHFAC